jgi:hypothetical protein
MTDKCAVTESLPLLHLYRWHGDYVSISIELVEAIMYDGRHWGRRGRHLWRRRRRFRAHSL